MERSVDRERWTEAENWEIKTCLTTAEVRFDPPVQIIAVFTGAYGCVVARACLCMCVCVCERVCIRLHECDRYIREPLNSYKKKIISNEPHEQTT